MLVMALAHMGLDNHDQAASAYIACAYRKQSLAANGWMQQLATSDWPSTREY